MVVLAASVFEISCGKTGTQTNSGENPTPATALGVDNSIARSVNGQSYVLRMFLFLFFPTQFFRRLQTEIFETFPHDVALLEKEARLCRFHKSAP